MKTQISNEDIKELFKGPYYLSHIDRSESFDENAKQLQQCIKENSYEAIELDINDDNEYIQVLDIKKNSLDSICQKFNVNKKIAKNILEEHEDLIEECIYQNNKSDPFKDLLDNTDKFIMFYDLGEEIESGSWNWSDFEIRKERNRIKKIIDLKINEYNDAIEMMIRQASYGGQLVVYFRDNFDKFICDEEFNEIEFKGIINLAIIDTLNGSGDNCEISHSFKKAFNRDNIFIDKTIKYNYSYAVCGMIESWCDDTKVNLNINKRLKKRLEKSAIGAMCEEDENLSKVFKSGKCTSGDMDINRHRNKTYINDYPCGNKCLDCGTFWID